MTEHFLSSDDVRGSLEELRTLMKMEISKIAPLVGVEINLFNHWEWDIPENILEMTDDEKRNYSQFFQLCQYLRIIDEKIGKEQ